MDKNITLSIIIVNYNVKALLKQSLHSIQKYLSDFSYEIIVIDNASKDASVDMISSTFPNVRLIANTDNVGFGRANNQGWEIAKGNYIFFLNPDTELVDDSVQRMIHFMDARPEVGMTAPRLSNSDGSLQRSLRPFYGYWTSLFDNRYMPGLIARFPKLSAYFPFLYDHSKTQSIEWAKGAALLFRREVLEKIGVFDPIFFIYGEEIDLCKRSLNAGYESWYLSDTNILHHEGRSTRQSRPAMFIQNYKSMFLFLAKHYPKKEVERYFRRVDRLTGWWLTYFSIAASLGKEVDNEQALYTSLASWLQDEGKQIVANSKS